MAAILAKPAEISPQLQDKVQALADQCMESLNQNLDLLNSQDQLRTVSGILNMANQVMESSGLLTNLEKANDANLLPMKSLVGPSGGNSTKVSNIVIHSLVQLC